MLKRMTIEFTEETWKALEQLRENTLHDDTAGVMRRALATYDLLHRLMDSGATIKAHYPDGRERIIEL